METFLVTLHVVAAVFIIGPMAILPMTAMRAVRAKQGAQVEVLARSTFVISLISLVVVLLGFAAMGASAKKYNLTIATPWILISLILYIVGLALNLVAVVPALRSAAEHLQATDTQDLQEADYKRIAAVSGTVALLLVAIVVLMAWRP